MKTKVDIVCMAAWLTVWCIGAWTLYGAYLLISGVFNYGFEGTFMNSNVKTDLECGVAMDDIELALFERGIEALEQIAKHLEFMGRLYIGGGGIDPRPWAKGEGGGAAYGSGGGGEGGGKISGS